MKIESKTLNPAFSSHRVLSGLLYVLFMSMLAEAGWGQEEPSQVQRILDEPFRVMMDEQTPTAKRAIFSWGGWYRSSVWDAEDHVDGMPHGQHVLLRQSLRLWGQVNLDQVHRIYARGRFDYLDWNNHISNGGDESDWVGPKLDRLWYDFNLGRARKAYGWGEGEDDFDFTLRVGRQYVALGTGLTLSTPLDAVWMQGNWRDWQVAGLLALSTTDAYNIDQSAPYDDEESRRYWGVQVTYTGIQDQTLFAYYFSQEDQDAGMQRPIAITPQISVNQTFGYDSRYVGVGSQGAFFHPQWQYTCEMAGEFGKSYAYDYDATGDVDRQNIEAWILDTELRYVIQDEGQSQVYMEYLLASGDPDRQYSPTDTIGGNRPHTTDLSFSGWGFRNTGLALAPVMSNLGMAKLGASTFPARNHKFFDQMMVGTDFYVYHKQQSAGAMSDSLSTENNKFVGTAVDLYANWRMTSDVAWTVRYGIFMPGNAFEETSERHQFFTGVTVNF